MRTPSVKKESTRRARTRTSDKEPESTDITMGDHAHLEEIVPVSEPPHQSHGLPSTNLSNLQSSHDYDKSDRERRSLSAMPIRNVDVDVKRIYSAGTYHSATSYDVEGLRRMGLEVSRLQDAIFDLHRFGVDEDFPLPELIVVGDQSAGKSSLIGGLAEIHLPRSGGTCTRCPTFIKTASSKTPGSPWTCKVSLQKKYFHVHGYQGKFGPWKQCSLEESPAEDIEFEVITDKNELERVLKWAQIAILNPSRDSHEYFARPENHRDTSIEVKFSPNLVCLEITGPELPSLSFYDLPGIIQVADESHLVHLVGNLVEHYIRHKNALILCALSMANDPATSSAIRLVRKLKAEKRCIGVITKPDILPLGHFDPVWLPLLRGEHTGFRLGYNYYVTKQPSYKPGDPLIEHSTARNDEEAFFKNQPWSAQSDDLREKWGTQKLQIALSQILSKQIKDRLPDITIAIEKKKSEIDAELRLLPELPGGDVQEVVLEKFSQFGIAVEKQMAGRTGAMNFQKDWRKLRAKFQQQITKLMPGFSLYSFKDRTKIPENPKPPNPSTPRRGTQAQPVDLEESDHESVQMDFPQLQYFKNEPSTPTANGRDHLLGLFRKRNRDQSPRAPAKKAKILEDVDYSNCAPHEFSLSEVRTTIEEISDGNLPGEVDPQVISELWQSAVTPWKLPLNIFKAATMNLVCKAISETLSEVLSCYSRTALYTTAMDQLNGFFNEIMMLQEERLDKILKLELKGPTTFNTDIYKKRRSEVEAFIRNERRNIRIKAHIDREENDAGKYTYGTQRAAQVAKFDCKKLGTDPFDTELNVMAKIGGYYLTVSPRFVDNVLLSIQVEMFEDITIKIQRYLQNALEVQGANGNEKCRSLMDEHPEVAIQRKRLRQKKEKLDAASDRLKKLAMEGSVEHQCFSPTVEDDVDLL